MREAVKHGDVGGHSQGFDGQEGGRSNGRQLSLPKCYSATSGTHVSSFFTTLCS